ncbi:uncharacterized protein LOC113003418 isoform X2 [Solenopsis invicta]|uniref:uncharacterized protein LOC113003418 isoform X2 n=1 Tax=Solenopsis invicta TaxID=13686 RepID=UPI00193D267A|nr:uncharacterized protein LOC113003418 isoform X2 [Solenopsis invicta]
MSHEIIELTIQDLLKDWNLDQYVSAFESNCIDVGELQLLLQPEWKDILNDLIPVPGHRMRFVKNLKELMKESKFVSIEGTSRDPSNLLSENIQKTPKNISSTQDTSNLSLEDSQETSKNISSQKRSRQSNEPNVKRGEELRLLLNKTATGRCILQLAKQGPCLKHDKDRNKLTEIIIEDELSKCEKISTAGFAELVSAIQHIFPEEDSELYFIPYKYSNGMKFVAKGKLITKYYSIRKDFKALGIITRNKDQLDSDSLDDSEDDDVQGKLNFLEENIEPWSTVVQYWMDTSKQRIAKLHAQSRVTNRNKDKDNNKRNVKSKQKSTAIPETTQISTYTNKFPALKENLGYTLFEIDFDLLYPEQKLKAYNSYKDFCDRIIQALTNEESKCEALKDNLLLVTSDDISEETRNLVALLSLCYLDTVVTVARQSGRTWRPPHTEIQEGVISLIESVGKLQTFMQERKKKLINWGITIQPYVLVCGSSVNDIDACYVILDTETQFLVQSPVRALDLCFKIINAAHLEYSPESYRLWRLIQKELYELTTEFDELKSDAQLPKLFKKFSRK